MAPCTCHRPAGLPSHRALAAVVCRVLGWDVARLPSIVIDPRGTLGQALAAEATADVELAKVIGVSNLWSSLFRF